MLATFKALCSLATFDGITSEAQTNLEHNENNSNNTPVNSQLQMKPLSLQSFPINLNIQLQLPATDDITIYDKLFASLRRHLIQPEA